MILEVSEKAGDYANFEHLEKRIERHSNNDFVPYVVAKRQNAQFPVIVLFHFLICAIFVISGMTLTIFNENEKEIYDYTKDLLYEIERF